MLYATFKTQEFVETKCNFGSLRVAFTFSLQLMLKDSEKKMEKP